ncbi:MAG: MBL fold metallo-hydrolase [Thermoanaerobaculia bacterium]|nr:MBL fold metallo-hydrolase [Thermoanaerobaculia bacterium]
MEERIPLQAAVTLLATLAPALILAAVAVAEPPVLEKDSIPTTRGDLEVTFVGHGSLCFRFAGKVLHVDPYGKLADYSTLPKADVVLITHAHGDHLDPAALAAVLTPATKLVVAPACAGKFEGATVLRNGEATTVEGVPVQAVPAYNLVAKRPDGSPFHPKGEGNGYVVTFGTTRVYVAGDTENVPEMKALEGVDVAFLPMNLPYTMTPEMVADAARAFRPRILYPYHFGETDPQRLVSLLADEKGIEVRVRKMR